jgi:hypothetical protein
MPLHDTAEQARRTTILRLALAAAEAGRAVFPLRGKVPLTSRGFKDASRDRARVTAMFNAAPNATGYGIATGERSGIVVVDVDGPEGRAEAERLGLRSDYVVRTGRKHDGWHLYLTIPPGVEVASRDLAPGVELKGNGAYVVGAGSLHPSGATYRAVKDGDPSGAPERVMEPEPEHTSHRAGPRGTATGPIAVDVAGPPIPDGERNRTLTRIAGKLHDGTRDLGTLTRDLLAVNDTRCTPPLKAGEVAKIASSIYRRTPCKARQSVTARVLAKVEYLEAAAHERPVRGMAGASGWAIYLAGLEGCRRFGREHPEGIALSLDTRTWAQMAGTEASTVSRWLRRSSLVEVLQRGSGRRSSTVLFRVSLRGRRSVASEGVQLQHSSTRGVSKEPINGSVATRPLLRTLYRSRWSERSVKPRRGVAHGTRKVRQSRAALAREGVARIGKSRAALLNAVVDCPGASRAELAARLGRKPASLKKPLRWLMDAGLIVRPSRGHYAPASALAERLDDSRALGGEPEADRLQIARHERQRDGYRNRHRTPPDLAPTEEEMRDRRESSPERRRAHIERAIARLFGARPEYRGRRVGQITCQLVNYLAADFPRGPDGLPKDAEVEAILSGAAA